jgi:transaldolase
MEAAVYNLYVRGGSKMENYFSRVQKLTPTRFWINNVTRSEADLAIKSGAAGCTQNPSYVWKILSDSEDAQYARGLLGDFVKHESDNAAVLVRLQRELVGDIAKRFMPLYEESGGMAGYVSIQGDPCHEDAESIIKAARFNREAGPNIMAKIPATEEGIRAMAVLAPEGVPINATECMAVRQVLDVCDTYVEASKKLKHPAPFYFSLITGIYDEYLQKRVREKGIDINQDVLWQAGIGIAKKVRAIVDERRYPCGFIGGGARGLHHFTEMVGADANITINWRGAADKLIEMDAPVVSRFLQPFPYSVEDELVEKLEDFRKAYFINAIKPCEYEEFGPVAHFRNIFVNAWTKTLEFIKEFRAEELKKT